MNPTITNRQAKFQYEILDRYTAGIQLTGTEVKALRQGKASLGECYAFVSSLGEIWVKNMHITEYSHGSHGNHLPLRERKLLLKKGEIEKINKKLQDKGLTLVPLKVFFNERGYAKMDIAIARGKKLHDKRQSIKDRDQEREMRREGLK